MKRFDQETASCHVYTFKDGLLSAVAHDLCLCVTRFSIEVAEQVRARFDASSLVVEATLKEGQEVSGALSAADEQKIARQIREEVLHCRRFPEITFQSAKCQPRADGGYDLEGALSLHGISRTISAQTFLRAERQHLTLTLHQPDYGIVPFRAMMGTLKIRPEVRIELVA